MAPDHTLHIESGDLDICPELGEIRNSRGELARLGPVNMKVLELLVGRAGQVVSRNELFDSVWANQVVSDDALTRAISDIRAELNRLSGNNSHIQTIPKRGYRWAGETRQLSAPNASARTPFAAAAKGGATGQGNGRPSDSLLARFLRGRAATLIGQALADLAALVLIASAGVWLLQQFARPGPPAIALLPTRADPAAIEFAATIDARLVDSLMRIDQIVLLSRTAVDTRPDNPFPYFYYEFGARWLIESNLQSRSNRTLLTVVVVDARTGIVLFQTSAEIGDETPGGLSRIGPDLAGFIASQLQR
jgi:DNA-binding winged helix-turn-helix (wHTH) protein